MIRNFLLIGLGGAIGAMLRYGITCLCQYNHFSTVIGTMFINIAGSFCMGLLVAGFSQSPWLLMATVGICGGFTTFSTFSMQTVTLLQQGNYSQAVLYMMASLLFCVAFAALGYFIGQKLL